MSDILSGQRVLKNYQMVEWIGRGRKPIQRKIDIVPRSWVTKVINKNISPTMCFYPPDASDDLLMNMIIDESPPQKNWPNYHVTIVGEASTFVEATTLYEKLKNGSKFASSSGDENAQAARAKRRENSLRSSQLIIQENAILEKQKAILEQAKNNQKGKKSRSSTDIEKLVNHSDANEQDDQLLNEAGTILQRPKNISKKSRRSNLYVLLEDNNNDNGDDDDGFKNNEPPLKQPEWKSAQASLICSQS